jgi:cysteine-rich repeat protein
MFRLTRIVPICFLAVLAVACPGEEDFGPLPGELGQSCYPDETCNLDLFCVAGMCRDQPAAHDAGASIRDAGPGDVGDGGTQDVGPADAGPQGFCGDGVVQDDEECDDGDLMPTDSCQECRRIGADLQQVTGEAHGYNAFAPRLAAAPDGNLFMVWQECTTADTGDEGNCEKKSVYAARKVRGSVLWDLPVEISPPASDGSANAVLPDVAVDASGVVHIVWADDGDLGTGVTDGADILYRSWDGTDVHGRGTVEVVSAGLDVAGELVGAERPSIQIGSQGPMVAFTLRFLVADRRRETFLARRISGWEVAPVSLGATGGSRGAAGARLVLATEDRPHMVWVDDRGDANHKVVYSWDGSGAGSPLSPQCDGDVDMPAAAMLNGELFVIYVTEGACSSHAGAKGIAVQRVGGAQEVLTADPIFAADSTRYPRPDLTATADGRLVATWVSSVALPDAGEDPDILGRVRAADGTWGEVFAVSGTADRAKEPAVLVDNGRVHIGWSEREAGDDGDYDIIYDVQDVDR